VEAEQSLHIVITDAGRPAADVLVDNSQVLVGSASHCDVRLGPDRLAKEQLMFELRSGYVFAEVRASRPQVLLNLSPFHSGRLRDDAVLTIGTLEIRARPEQRYNAGKKHDKEGVKPTFVATLFLLCVLFVVAVMKLSRNDAQAEAPLAPALFTAEDKPCPEQSEEGALSAALELIAQADGKRERAPFLPEEGLLAVPLYRTAALCLDIVKAERDAKIVRGRAHALQSRVERDYHLHQVRVYRAIASSDAALLAREAQVLSAYLKGGQSAYGAWLDALARDLEVEASKNKKQKKRS
jgi:hypothetical protein